MTEVFQRDFSLVVGNTKFEDYRVIFKVKKNDKRDPNTCEIEIHGLNKSQRAEIAKLNPDVGSSEGIPVKLEVGYKSTGGREILWLGDLRTGISYKSGPTWVTKIASGDGEAAIRRTRIQKSFPPDTRVENVIRAIIAEMKLGQGNVAQIASDLKAGNLGTLALDGAVLSGPASYHLDNWTRSAGLLWSVQDNSILFLKKKKPLDGRSVVLNKGSGMIGTPSINAKGVLSVSSFIIPGITVGGVVIVESSSVIGQFQIKSVDYNGDTRGQAWNASIQAKRF